MKSIEAILSAPRYSLASPNQSESSIISARILVVDDVPGVRHTLESVLRGAGCSVSCAEDGERGWEALCGGNFDLLITDHDMPRLTGLDLLRRLRAAQSSLPVILISGKMPWDAIDLLDLLRPGMAMEKPFSFTELLAFVRNLVSQTPRAELVCQG